MKKMNNKGFSLVELIIVIAIMAILAGAIAPALIKYIDKSRRSNDVSAAKEIKKAVENAMANDKAFEEITGKFKQAGEYAVITIEAKTKTADGPLTFTTTGTGTLDANTTDLTSAMAGSKTEELIMDELAGKTPKVNYKKNNSKNWIAVITFEGVVYVGLDAGSGAAAADTDNEIADVNAEVNANIPYCLTPDTCDDYE